MTIRWAKVDHATRLLDRHPMIILDHKVRIQHAVLDKPVQLFGWVDAVGVGGHAGGGCAPVESRGVTEAYSKLVVEVFAERVGPGVAGGAAHEHGVVLEDLGERQDVVVVVVCRREQVVYLLNGDFSGIVKVTISK